MAATTRTSTLHRLGAADAPDLALLQHAQELRLHCAPMSPISSRKRVPPCGLLEEAALGLHRAGEGALGVAEQLALEQRLGQRGAVDGHERARARAASCGWIARATSSLPVPLSPATSTVDVGRRHARRPSCTRRASAASCADDRLDARRLGASAPERAVLLEQAAALERAPHRGGQLLHVEGLGDVVVGAASGSPPSRRSRRQRR